MTHRTLRKTDRRGNYTMLMGVTAFTIIGFSAFSVDISLITMAELQAQAAADAASHAALIAFRENLSTSEGNIAASFMIDVNEVAMGTATIDSIEYGQWDFTVDTFTPGLAPSGNANAVRVDVSRRGANTVDLLLAPLLGVLNHDVDGRAVTSQQQRAIMLIQDMSGSMMSGIPNDTRVAIEISRQANLEFLNFLNFRPQSGDLLGLAMFAEVAVNPPFGPHPWGNTGILPWLSLQSVEDNDPLIRERINGICDTYVGGAVDIGIPGPLDDLCRLTGAPQPHCPVAGRADRTPCGFPFADIGACTNPAPAVLQAINELTTNSDDGFFRGIVLMSDGLPTCTESSSGFPFDPRSVADANAAADLADANGISIWTILFHNGSFDPGIMGCDPTDSDGDGEQDDPGFTRGIGFCQSSPNAADLPDMYRKVAESLPTAFVQ